MRHERRARVSGYGVGDFGRMGVASVARLHKVSWIGLDG